MTNKTTEQDMEAKSVDKNDATLIESPDNNEETATGSADDTLDAIDEKQETPEAADTTTSADLSEEIEAAEPEMPEPVVEKFDDSIIAPGSLSRALKKCREEADMSMEDAAGEMHLPLSVIKALEEENFADLPDPPYVRGYLRSYARLNESDATNLINRYETLRGADPRDSSSFTPVTPRYQPNNKKAVSPTTIKLAGFSMIVLLMVVLSMIPAVSQWASDTWQSFSEPQNQKLAAARKAKADAANTDTDANAQATAETTPSTNTQSTNMASSSSDTAVPGNTEQLALNQEATDTGSTENTAEQDSTAGQTAESAATDAPAGETEQAAEGTTDNTETTGEDDAADTAQAAADDKNDPTAVDGSDTSTDAPATETTNTDNTDTATQEPATTREQDTAAAEAEAARQKQAEAQAAAEKAAAEKAEADKAAAAAAAQQDDNFQQPIDGSVFIRLVFTQDVWMSIKDGRGKTIFGALNAAGTRKDLRANTPLQFKVGNAPGVQIYLNGQLIDQKPYTRGSVSNFRAN